VTKPQPLQRLSVGVVVEKRKLNNPWAEFSWRAVAVLPGAPDTAPWTMLDEQHEVWRFYAGASEIELFAPSGGYYRDNLANGVPSLWVVLRPTGLEPAFQVLTVTADPNEGEAFTQAGDDLVEAVAMPEPIREAIEAFVAQHHIETQFVKRQRDTADPEALARRAPMAKRDENGE
jgi:Protein of unknown function (DUF3305)